MLLLLLPLLASGAPSSGPCCSSKTVGGLDYTLVREDSSALSLSCLAPCVYERGGAGGAQYCFARGEQEVFCGNATSDPAGENGPRPCNGPDYIHLPAAEKMAIIWKNCQENQTSGKWLSQAESVGIMSTDMCLTFNTEGDELPTSSLTGNTKKKFVHTAMGTVGRVEWIDKGGHPYTGIFKGATEGIARLSLAIEPSPPAPGIVPGMALKFTRDDMDSVNLVAIHNPTTGQDSWNFFANIFSTHTPAGSTSVVATKFSEATNNIFQVGVSDWANYEEDRTKVAAPVFPYRLRFRPTGKIVFSDSYVQDIAEDLKTIPIDSVLYEILALDQPEELGGQEVQIGDLVLRSPMITSLWGDQHLFFRHNDEARDLAIKPEWNKFTPQFGSDFEEDPLKSSKCPFA